ncbi:hypothetical protein [Gorillibacterium sp. sgz5001074]
MEQFYCIGCKSHILRKDAKLVMKTGFYKSLPLGVCNCCSCKVLP